MSQQVETRHRRRIRRKASLDSGTPSTWRYDKNTLPKLRIEECGLTVELNNFNNQYSQRQSNKGTPPNRLPSLRSSVTPPSSGRMTEQQRLLGAEFCKCREEYGFDDTPTGDPDDFRKFVDYMRIGRCRPRSRLEYEALRVHFERAASMPASARKMRNPNPGVLLRYSHSQPIERRAISDIYKHHDEQKIVQTTSDTTPDDKNLAQEQAIIRRLATKRQNQSVTFNESTSSSESARQATDTDIWVSNPEGCDLESPQFYPMPEFLHHLYETRDAFIQTLRSRAAANSVKANIRLAQELTRPNDSRSSKNPRHRELLAGEHNASCPLCLHYIPRHYGHVCPPNTPFSAVRTKQLKRSDKDNDDSDSDSDTAPVVAQTPSSRRRERKTDRMRGATKPNNKGASVVIKTT